MKIRHDESKISLESAAEKQKQSALWLFERRPERCQLHDIYRTKLVISSFTPADRQRINFCPIRTD